MSKGFVTLFDGNTATAGSVVCLIKMHPTTNGDLKVGQRFRVERTIAKFLVVFFNGVAYRVPGDHFIIGF